MAENSLRHGRLKLRDGARRDIKSKMEDREWRIAHPSIPHTLSRDLVKEFPMRWSYIVIVLLLLVPGFSLTSDGAQEKKEISKNLEIGPLGDFFTLLAADQTLDSAKGSKLILK